MSPLVFEYKPTFLNDSSWQFHRETDPFNYYNVRYYKTATYFASDIPLAKDNYLR